MPKAKDPPSQYETPTPKGKGGRKKKEKAPPAEKRAARLKKACPQTILERADRVMTQRFFMIDRKREGGQLREEFHVLGSTGNVYTVVIDKLPSCDCPDAGRGNHCKHILFVFFKVLHVPHSSVLWYQKALLSDELYEIFNKAPPSPAVMADDRVRRAFSAFAQGSSSQDASGSGSQTQPGGATNSKQRIPEKDDDCPVCYENMHNAQPNTLTFCEECGNGLHMVCFQQWARATPNITCVFCRAPWKKPTATSGGAGAGPGSREGYINLSSVANVSPVRDTSSYYSRRRYGYGGYGY